MRNMSISTASWLLVWVGFTKKAIALTMLEGVISELWRTTLTCMRGDCGEGISRTGERVGEGVFTHFVLLSTLIPGSFQILM